MKLIFIKDEEGIKYINPLYVRSVKQFQSVNTNNDWCIVIEMDDHTTEIINSKTGEESDLKMIEISVAMEATMAMKGE